MKLIVVTHYAFGGIGGDYESVSIESEQGEVLKSYGDYYHDKGDEKVQGFLDGLSFGLGAIDVEVKYISKDDGEYDGEKDGTYVKDRVIKPEEITIEVDKDWELHIKRNPTAFYKWFGLERGLFSV